MTGYGWTEPADLRARLRRRWERGDLLRNWLAGNAAPQVVPLRGPTAAQLADDLPAVIDWATRWRAVRGVRLETRPLGGRAVGINQVPARVVIPTPDAVWSLLGVRSEVSTVVALIASADAGDERLGAWARTHPMRVLAVADAWDRALAVVSWVEAYAGPSVYLRQIDVPGVDTKFVAAHAGLLSDLLQVVLPESRIDAGQRGFAARFMFRSPPERVRLRTLDPALALPGGFSDLEVPVAELVDRPPPARRVVVVENEVTFLALPPTPGSMAVFGSGYAVRKLAPLRWLQGVQLDYWGDLDTHGFAILDALRAHHGHARSLLMDSDTLLAHRAHWGREPTPSNAILNRLTSDEAAVVALLRGGSLGANVRLEQERIRFGRVREALQARG